MPDRTSGVTMPIGPNLSGYLAPASAGAAGIVVIQEAFGVNAFVKATCDRLAANGYHAIAPDYFHGRTFDYSDLENAIAAVNDVDDDLAMRETALALDAMIGARATGPARRDRLLHGWPPCVPRKRNARGATCRHRIVLRRRHRATRTQRQAQAVARDITAPALLIYGAQDRSIGAEEHGRLARALTEANKRYAIAVFPDAPHAFATFDRESYREPAATAAWRTANAFLDAAFSG